MGAIKIHDYDLPDKYLLNTKTKLPQYLVWVPSKTSIILGKSNNSESALNVDAVISDNIPVFKRPSGGETVLLTEKMIVISAVLAHNGISNCNKYFRFFNGKIVECLSTIGINNLSCKGISDIAINDLKICGSAIYQNKYVVFYHAVLNVAESIELINKYLQHPEREPDYRLGRSHLEFVTSLRERNYKFPILMIKNIIEQEFDKIKQNYNLQ